MKKTLLLSCLLLCPLPQAAHADVTLPGVLTDNMVLQRKAQDAIWGTASPGEIITVTFAGKSATAKANAEGDWLAHIGPFTASSTPRDLEIKGHNTIALHNILVGDVWLGSGQSNMEYAMGSNYSPTSMDPFTVRPDHTKRAPYMVADLAAANDPQLRIYRQQRPPATQRGWAAVDPHTLSDFSAVLYYFGREIRKEVDVPIGLIETSVGGSRIELWVSPQAFSAIPTFKGEHQIDGVAPGHFWSLMVKPLVPYTLRGFLWYQGEANIVTSAGAARYTDKMEALIDSWRTAFDGPKLPFYFVQMAPLIYSTRKHNNEDHPLESYSELHEQQTQTLKIPNTGMVVTTDLADAGLPNNIHPQNKRPVGERLARWALAKDYGHTSLPYSGPVFRSMTISGNKAVLHFDHTDGGLQSRDHEALTGFTVALADKHFVPAHAEIKGDTIEVSGVDNPAAVRFAWGELDNPNLVNGAGLPAVPFRTDGPAIPAF